jgi:hypothetical protein
LKIYNISLNNIIGVKTTKVLQYGDPTRNLCYNNTWEKKCTNS